MKKIKQQVLLKRDGWKITRSDDIYGYRFEEVSCRGGKEYIINMPFSQEDVKRWFEQEGLEWRWENR